jgi:DNA ligase-1
LQKYKEFFENEYEICGFREAEGRDKGTVIWFCRLPNDTGSVFSVRPRGTLEMRRTWFLKGDDYIGKKLTVIYQELSEYGVPRFPVGKCIRDEY